MTWRLWKGWEDCLEQWLIHTELPLLFDRKQIMPSEDVTLWPSGVLQELLSRKG